MLETVCPYGGFASRGMNNKTIYNSEVPIFALKMGTCFGNEALAKVVFFPRKPIC